MKNKTKHYYLKLTLAILINSLLVAIPVGIFNYYYFITDYKIFLVTYIPTVMMYSIAYIDDKLIFKFIKRICGLKLK